MLGVGGGGDFAACRYSIYVDLEFEDKSMGYGFMVPFAKKQAPGTTTNATSINGQKRWKCGLILPPKPVSKIFFHLLFRHQVGVAEFHRAVVQHLTYSDVCTAFLRTGESQPTLPAAVGANATDSDAAQTQVETTECQGHFTKKTPLLL